MQRRRNFPRIWYHRNWIFDYFEKKIRQNLDTQLTHTDNELAVAILVESRIHDLERSGLVLVKRNDDGTTIINLTAKGKTMSRNIQKDIRE